MPWLFITQDLAAETVDECLEILIFRQFPGFQRHEGSFPAIVETVFPVCRNSTVIFRGIDDVQQFIGRITDPEIMINIWDMGLVYKIDQKENGDVYIEMTVTSPMCPVAGVLPQQAADAVALVAGVGEVEVKIVWEPAWTLENLSEEAKEMFELF